MLVLSRKPGEQIQIGENVTITVIEIRGNRAKIGIEAPRSVDVVRGELDRRHDVTPAYSQTVCETMEVVICGD